MKYYKKLWIKFVFIDEMSSSMSTGKTKYYKYRRTFLIDISSIFSYRVSLMKAVVLVAVPAGRWSWLWRLGWGVDLGPPRVQHSVDLVLAWEEPCEILIGLKKSMDLEYRKQIYKSRPMVPPPYSWCAWPRPWRPASRGRRPACTRSPRRTRRRRTGTPGPGSPLRTGEDSVLRMSLT